MCPYILGYFLKVRGSRDDLARSVSGNIILRDITFLWFADLPLVVGWRCNALKIYNYLYVQIFPNIGNDFMCSNIFALKNT